MAVVLAVVAVTRLRVDPDDERRDRMVDKATALIDSVELPPGYVQVPWDDDWHHPKIQGATTPLESKQLSADATLFFRAATPTTPARVLDDFTRWFQDRGYVPATYSGVEPLCVAEGASRTWAKPDHVVRMSYNAHPNQVSRVSIPFSYLGIPGGYDSSVKVPALPPVCP